MARIISAAIMIPVAILVVIYARPVYFLIGIGLIGTVCLYEYYGLLRLMKVQVQPLFGYLAFWVLLIALRQGRFPATVVLALVLLAGFFSTMWRGHQPPRERATALMSELFGVFYLVLCLYPTLPVRYDFGDRTGLHWFLVFLGVIWAGDTAALVVGKTLGKTRFAPILSPKKTYEGSVAGLLGGMAVAALMQHFLFPDLPLRHVMITSVLLGFFGQMGDLAESMLKRAAETKDSSQLIPGHGGVLDRMDSMLFAFPVLYMYMLQLYR
jgi:phosphatidate cytidylyltransferase